jgi:hypothetical protein
LADLKQQRSFIYARVVLLDECHANVPDATFAPFTSIIPLISGNISIESYNVTRFELEHIVASNFAVL